MTHARRIFLEDKMVNLVCASCKQNFLTDLYLSNVLLRDMSSPT